MSTEKAIERDQVSEREPTTAALEGEVRGQQQLLIDESQKSIFLLYLRTITHSSTTKACSDRTNRFFFCWWLLGLIPGGAPFSQLNKGVKDAIWTSINDKNMQEGH